MKYLTTEIGALVEKQWLAGQKLLAKATEKATERLLDFSTYSAEWLEKYITNHEFLINTKRRAMRLQCEQDSVIIIGPSGTGKEILARALHGSRSGKFVGVNCTSLPDQLIESELFGHVKGAFTGALESRPGKFEEAFNGTLFLDEIGDMPLNMQTKLLRVLQERTITPVGSNKEQPINCRVIAATNRTVDELLEKKHFRADLYYRLAVFTLETLPLKDRICDIEDIVDSLGGEELITEFEKWKMTQEGLGSNPEENERLLYQEFFDLDGNVRSLQAQVRNWQVFKQV